MYENVYTINCYLYDIICDIQTHIKTCLRNTKKPEFDYFTQMSVKAQILCVLF